MLKNFISPSPLSLKRQCVKTENEVTPKKSKSEESNINFIDQVTTDQLQSDPLEQIKSENDGRKVNNKIKLVSLILNGRKENVQIYPGQIVWCRQVKSPFWPSMVWSTKTGKITDDNQRVLVKFFAKKETNVWMKLDNIFPFDGLESFEKMKNSVNVLLMTTTMRKDFDFAFNITNERWPQAVAEAIYCLRKDRDERLALFLAFSSSFKFHKNRKKPLQRRAHQLNISNSCLVKGYRVNDEMFRLQSFIKEISFPIAEIPTNSRSTETVVRVEEMLLKFVTHSLAGSKFDSVDRICNICFSHNSTEKLFKCVGTCDGYLHQKCFEICFPQRLADRATEGESTNLMCKDCADQSNQFCFICKTDGDASRSEMINCTMPNCWRSYHMNCLKYWPQAQWKDSNRDLICPSHGCHQCAYKDIDDEAMLTNCIKCPTTLHSRSTCIQAGTIILSDSHHICIKHRQLRGSIWNLDYCYICKTGCNLLYCQTCPHSFHEICLSSKTTSTSTSHCAKCFNGQHPVYGEIIWGKLYTYAWWPAIIVPPDCIPPNIRTDDDHSSHDFVLFFFGDHKFSWIERESVHPFDEDNFALFTENSIKFSEAVSSARKWVSQVKCIKFRKPTDIASTSASTDLVGPAPYINILKNIPVAPATLFFDLNNEASSCECDVNDDDPCGIGSNCLNRASCMECSDLCHSGDKCGNKCIQQGKYADVTLKYFGSKGFGLISAKRILSGTIVSQYTGEVITSNEFECRMQNEMRSNVYFMKYSKDLYIDAETKGSLARFINHSCNPNCSFHPWSVNGVNVVAVVALKDIPKDTEITCKYDWSRNIPCLCNAKNCTGYC